MLTTKSKIALARYVSRGVIAVRKLCRRPPGGCFQRKNLRWQLDLREGIDFSIFLLGAFEPSLLAFYQRRIKRGEIVLDIGANIGAHTLHFARAVAPDGRVVAIEATDYAFGKLQANLDLNPALKPYVRAHHALLADSAMAQKPAALPASWPLEGGQGLNADHQGKLQSVGEARVLPLDDLVADERLEKVDWIKLDVDGNELSVLRGAKSVLRGLRPRIFMELAPSYYQNDHFDELIAIIRDQGYHLYSIPALRLLPSAPAGLKKMIPAGASMNIMLDPKTEI
ncbi:MAG TPA: FkbM family methyltransferase [Candidatus Acidoferrales bacterium]|nr:FkbM family methyltransferase [Candidatus Acidoferrales bacterium]